MNILITGGASGLGESITKALLNDDRNIVYFTYCKSKENASKIENQFENTKAIPCNFEDSNSIQLLLDKMEELNLEILINNAITSITKNYFHKLNSEDFANSYTKNILPTIKITQKAIMLFRKQKFGKIITILSSSIINKPLLGWSQYVAEKNYLLSLSKSWAVENISFNITSNCVSPTYMNTPINNDTDERIVEEMTKNHPLKKLLTTEEVAESVVFLSNCKQHINGTNLIINAGLDVI
jgi:3-oxoacyl-[acyl-carrier protein] reductase